KQSGPFSATCEVKTERAKECRLLFILHRRDLEVEKLKWIYILKSYFNEKERKDKKTHDKTLIFLNVSV
ncbi:hypothetical protein, partial [Bacillus sp. AFS019443]|uniref:hypothetical protein n=1 Tax=Bacillus sp. AFS019443 TaxID=2034279 RepID=UPI000BFAEFFE